MARVFDELELGYLKEVLDRGELGLVPDGLVKRFEKAFAEMVGSKLALARNNAMNALAEAVSVSGAGPGTEVICDPVVHFGALAALYFNAVPRFADVQYETFNLDPESVRENISDKTRALIVTNLWGLCAELDELRAICDEHGIFMIEDCAHTIDSYWKGKHAGTYGHVGVFSFQEYKHLSTGDGGMTVTDDEELYRKMEEVWAFSGESPYFLTLNWRMNEMTAAVGLGQLQRVKGYTRDQYNVTLTILNEAIKGCEWLKERHVPKEAVQSGYWWACVWEGDKYGLDHNRFKKLNDELEIGLRFGFNQTAPYEFDLFRVPTAYHHPDCPIRCPYYIYSSDYRYRQGLCPTVEDLMPRLVTVNLIFLAIEEAKEKAEKLQEAIHKMTK